MKFNYYIFAIITFLFFTYLFSINLNAQGLFYDEALLAIGSYSYKGLNSPLPSSYSLNLLPIFINEYIGGLKSAIFGIFLLIFNQDFTILNWRLMGIFLFLLGLAIFIITTRLKSKLLILFIILILTDINTLLNIRFDFGPVALSFFLRFIFVCLIYNFYRYSKVSKFQAFLLGLVIGLSIYDKLSSIILLIPLCLFFITTILNRIKIKSNLILITFLGLLLGLFPVIIFNIKFLINQGKLFSILSMVPNHVYSFLDLKNFYRDYTGLASGNFAVKFMLGEQTPSIYQKIEVFTLSLLSLFLLLLNLLYIKLYKRMHLSFLFLLFWLVIGIQLYFFPLVTDAHHQIIGTPFHYLSIIYIFLLIQSSVRNKRIAFFLTVVTGILLLLWLIVRSNNLASTIRYLIEGKYSNAFHKDFTSIGSFAKNNFDSSFFIASDWGIANQIYVLSGGKNNLIDELFWNYEEEKQLYQLVKQSGKKYVYIISLNPPSFVKPAATIKILEDADKSQFLKKIPIESELEKLKRLKIDKYLNNLYL